MHFSQEAFKGTHFKIKAEHNNILEDLKAGCSTGGEPVFCQNNDEFVAFDQLCQIQETENSQQSLKYFFPDSNQIENRLNDSANLTETVEKNLPTSSKVVIENLLEQIRKLSPAEKMLLYLKLPTGKEMSDPLKQPLNPLGSRSEISQTIAWIKTHLEEDSETSIPKQDVYSEYLEYSSQNGIKPLSTADFGKVMKQVYPNVRPRRLGTRGNSRYCYSGMTCRTELPSPSLPRLMSNSGEEGGRTCAWAAQVLGTPISSLSDLESHLASRGLPTSSKPLTPISPNDGTSYIMSSKISKFIENEQLMNDDSKRKAEDCSSISNKTPPERCKGKKRSNGKKMNDGKKNVEEEVKRSKGLETDLQKLPIPRLVRPQKPEQLQLPRKQQKCLQPKEQLFIENGNSLEQEEELLKYFQSGSEEPKVSQLRLLLERKEDKSQTRRRVSFETVPESPKKFSFVPISPVSPFVQPQRILNRSCSVSSPVGKGQPKVVIPPKEEERSQSLPMLLPQDTPVPSETIDFGIDTDSSNLLIIDESSESLLIGSGMNNENLNAIYSIISEMETHSRSYSNTPTYSRSLQSSNIPSTSLFDDLDCDVSLGNLASDVNLLGTDLPH